MKIISPKIKAIVLIIIIIVPLVYFYIEKNSGLLVIETKDSLDVYIDNKKKSFVAPSDNGLSYKIKSGEHNILLNKAGYWPWNDVVTISNTKVTTIYPFFVPKNTSGYVITKKDPEYEKIMAKFNSSNTHIKGLKFIYPINSSDFYKDRADVAVIAVDNGIYALEITDDQNPNFQPIYKGSKPEFVKKDNDFLYVKDGNSLMMISY